MTQDPPSIPERWKATHRETAELLGITEPSLTKAVQERGCPVVAAGGPGKKATYDLRAVVAWRTAELKAAARNLDVERARLAKEQADRVSRENARQAGRLVPVEDVRAAADQANVMYRESAMALPSRLAAVLIGETDPLKFRSKIEAEIRHSLEALARTFGERGKLRS